MSTGDVASLAIVGLGIGSIYGLIALGLNVVFATTRVVNIAQGDLFMAGTMLGALFYGALEWPLYLAILATMGLTILLSLVEERIAIRPVILAGRGAFGWVLSTLGTAIILTAAFTILMGPDFRNFPPVFPFETIVVADVRIQVQHVGFIAIGVLMTGILHLFYGRTLLGQALGAVSQDPEAAAFRGIPVERMSQLSFAIGGGMAAGTGFIAAPTFGAFAAVGFPLLLTGFVAAAVGGIPSLKGALIGGYLVGLIEVFGVAIVGAGYRTPLVFGVLLLVLVIRPEGLLTGASVRSV